ncbi:cation efflux family protein [Klebsormidium nitens]|uniref:Cation efflux family protein n=1 Tax=Klebsormidium nitens TaxID=105231 RepID=A0A1Y1I8G0_KLENI|nr:cation efflux family protein [Klebsormidium nitens]|eukprot:GAQ84388.1 cation efflux family protein [Klebsormidium nitens]
MTQHEADQSPPNDPVHRAQQDPSNAASVTIGGPLGAAAPPPTLRPLYLMCIFLFICWLKPSEPFLVDFYVDIKGLTNKQVVDRVFPLWQYSHLPALLLVAVASEAVGCKAVVVAGAVCGAATVALTLFPTRLAVLQMAELTVALSMASHSAAWALVYGSLPTGRYQIAAHFSRAAALAGSCLAAVLGQLMRPRFPLKTLFGASLAGQAVAFLVACCLPATRKTPPAHVSVEAQSPADSGTPRGGKEGAAPPGLVSSAVAAVGASAGALGGAVQDVGIAVRVEGVLPWTLWAVAAGAVHRATLTYWQSLVRVKGGPSSRDYNGYFSAVSYLAAAAIAFATFRAPLRRFHWAVLLGSPALCGALLLAAARPAPLLSTYALLLAYQCVHEVSAIVCSTVVATAIATADATATSRALHRLSTTASRVALLRSTADQRLAVLFAGTAAASVAAEAGMQAALQHGLRLTLPQRFATMGAALLVLALGLAGAGVYATGLAPLRRLLLPAGAGSKAGLETGPVGRLGAARGQPTSPFSRQESAQERVPLLGTS